jgi:hypothetical protein
MDKIDMLLKEMELNIENMSADIQKAGVEIVKYQNHQQTLIALRIRAEKTRDNMLKIVAQKEKP